jgi:hypothetical protein
MRVRAPRVGEIPGPVIAEALRLVGPVGAGREAETRLERLAMVREQLERLQDAAQNPYQRNFEHFLRELVWTTDEARGGRVARVPEWDFLSEIDELLITRRKLLIEKSRRVFASWTVCAFDLWLAAGGQDPRWPELMLGNSHRQIFIVARKFEKPGSDWFLQSRVRTIYDQFELHGGRDHWPEFPKFAFKEGEATGSNGSHITAVAQGANQLRGPGATFVHCEEAAFWELAQPTMEGLLPTLLGGGHVVVVTTAQAGTYAQQIRDGTLNSKASVR